MMSTRRSLGRSPARSVFPLFLSPFLSLKASAAERAPPPLENFFDCYSLSLPILYSLNCEICKEIKIKVCSGKRWETGEG